MMTPENKNTKSPQKKKLFCVDMTPMVDLGFLLITFFMFTTNFSKPNVMDLGLPAKSNKPIPDVVINEKNSINFIIGKDNKVYYHQKQVENLSSEDMKETSLDGNQIINIIADAKMKALDQSIFTVIIKPTEDANYKNFVDMLDNMAISNNERYGITDLKPQEAILYKDLNRKLAENSASFFYLSSFSIAETFIPLMTFLIPWDSNMFLACPLRFPVLQNTITEGFPSNSFTLLSTSSTGMFTAP